MKLIAMAKGVPMGGIVEELIEKMWEKEQDSVRARLSHRITRDVRRMIDLMMKPNRKTFPKYPPNDLLTN